MAGHGAYHPERVTVTLSKSLRTALDARVAHTKTDSLTIYIREVLEGHMADIRAAKRLEQPAYIYDNREPVEEIEP